MGPKGPQAEGGTVDLAFTLDDGSTLEVAAKVMKRASGVGKSIRGSSLVLQVEQALGVGTGSLRSHGNQIQTMSKTISRRAR